LGRQQQALDVSFLFFHEKKGGVDRLQRVTLIVLGTADVAVVSATIK